MRPLIPVLFLAAIFTVGTAAAVHAQSAAVAVRPHSGPAITPNPSPTPNANPLTISGYVRSYYFTRQYASNNPGVQFDFTPKAPYISNGVNQASWSTGIGLTGAYHPAGDPWYASASYFYSNPMNGPCSVAVNNLKGAKYPSPNCTSQIPPNTNPDEAMPPYTLSALYQAYVGYQGHGWDGKIGDMLFTSPWANPADTRLKPAAFQGADLSYHTPTGFTLEAADMVGFQGRSSATFSQTTTLTSYPGTNGLPSNIFVPGCSGSTCTGIVTPGFTYGKLGFSGIPGVTTDAYYYDVADLVTMWWFDGQYTWTTQKWQPFIRLQGGTDHNSGLSYLGNVNSSVLGAQIGATPWKNVRITFGFDSIPWRTTTVVLPKGVSCSSSGAAPSYQLKVTPGTTFPYFLPSNAAQCDNNPNGTTTLYLGGWASPYTDAYTSDPLFTTSDYQGMIQHRAPGTSEKLSVQWTSKNNKVVVLASDAWYDYGNAAASQITNEWDLDGRYRFNHYDGIGPYRGLSLRERYQQRTATNTYYGGDTLPAPSYLGGQPLFKYNRLQLEYDF